MVKLETVAQARKRLKLPKLRKWHGHLPTLSEEFAYHRGWKEGFKACSEIYREAFHKITKEKFSHES